MVYRDKGWMMKKLDRDKVIAKAFDKLEAYDQDAISMTMLYSVAFGVFLDTFVDTLEHTHQSELIECFKDK